MKNKTFALIKVKNYIEMVPKLLQCNQFFLNFAYAFTVIK